MTTLMALPVLFQGMDAGDFILAATSVLTVLGAFATLVWNHRRDRNQPVVDAVTAEQGRAELRKMVDETNSYRDYRIWQLEAYLDLDREWHRDVVAKFDKVLTILIATRADALPPDIDFSQLRLPLPPQVPEPPRRGH